MTLATEGRKPVIIPMIQGAASKMFGKFASEPEMAVREQVVTKDKKLNALLAVYNYLGFDGHMTNNGLVPHFIDDVYNNAASWTRDIACSPADIEGLSVALTQFQDEPDFPSRAGIFISALINYSKETGFTVRTKQLACGLNYLCMRNWKDVGIDGDVGESAGWRMSNGSVTIEGDTDRSVGEEMTGGLIIVRGRAGSFVGSEMKGGEIRLEGSYADISNEFKYGRIFHKKRQLRPERGGWE